MERRLQEAAQKGSVSSLLELLEEDPHLLAKTIVDCNSETPLHIAAMLGHVDFTKKVLSQMPQLASELDSLGSSPLHFASAKGYIEIVKELLSVDPDICRVQDQEGRTPFHLAAIKGRVEVLTELLRVKPEATVILTHREETILHLCVKHNRLEILKVLMEWRQQDEFVNWKDHEGNTILHLAVAKKQIETINFLLTGIGVEVNTTNANGFTALDVLAQSPRDLKDMEIRESLKDAGALSANDLTSVASDRFPTKIPQPAQTPLLSQKSNLKKQVKKKHEHKDWLGRKESALMVVASLIATVAFQAGLAPPGGVWEDELITDSDGNPAEKPHHVGMSIMAYEHANAYGQFMIFNTIAFLASLSIMLLLVSGIPLRRRRWMWVQMVIMCVAITALALTYFIALVNMTPNLVEGVLYHVTKISFITWLGLITILIIVHVIRMTLWFKKRKRGRSGHEAAADEEHFGDKSS